MALVSQLPDTAASSDGWSHVERLLALNTELTHVLARGMHLKTDRPLRLLPGSSQRSAVSPKAVARQLERG